MKTRRIRRSTFIRRPRRARHARRWTASRALADWLMSVGTLEEDLEDDPQSSSGRRSLIPGDLERAADAPAPVALSPDLEQLREFLLADPVPAPEHLSIGARS